MTVAVDSILRIVASSLWDPDGEVAQNVFNAKVTGGGAPWDDQDIVDDAEDWLDNMYLNLVADQTWHLLGNEVLVYKYDAVGEDWDEVSSNTWSYTPTNTEDYTARGVAALVRLWTTDPDVQGKKYIPGMCEDNIADGLFDVAQLTTLLAFAADWYLPFVGAASGATFTPGIWSVVNTLFVAGVDHIAANAIPAYQRRRKQNVGI